MYTHEDGLWRGNDEAYFVGGGRGRVVYNKIFTYDQEIGASAMLFTIIILYGSALLYIVYIYIYVANTSWYNKGPLD